MGQACWRSPEVMTSAVLSHFYQHLLFLTTLNCQSSVLMFPPKNLCRWLNCLLCVSAFGAGSMISNPVGRKIRPMNRQKLSPSQWLANQSWVLNKNTEEKAMEHHSIIYRKNNHRTISNVSIRDNGVNVVKLTWDTSSPVATGDTWSSSSDCSQKEYNEYRRKAS